MKGKQIPWGIQTFCAEVGEAACYALAIMKAAERELERRGIDTSIDTLAMLTGGIQRGYIRYNWENERDDDNFFVDDPAGFFAWLTGIPCKVRKEDASYKAKETELVIQRWERKRVGATTGHFRLADWDSLRDSQTVKFGEVASLRIIELRG